MENSVNYRKIFADICNGFSVISRNHKTVYIKHFSHFDQTDLDTERERYFNIAKSRGILSLEEKMTWLNDNQLWTKQKETELSKYKSYLENLKITRKQIVASVQIKDMDRQIEEASKQYYDLENEKKELIGYTCETYSEEKIQSFYIYNSFYSDRSLETKMFTIEEFEELDDDELNSLLFDYIEFIKNFNNDIIKKISVSSFFCSHFYLVEDITKFLGKPMAFLTTNQLNLISYGQYYKHLLRTHGENLPKEIAENPDAIEDYVNRANNVKRVMAKTAGNTDGGVGIIGATKDDMKGIRASSGSSILEKSKAMGGISNIRDAIMLSG